ncbi:MAG: DnaD domain protein [Streptococcaceae bacterium]|jgi:replication initiation and membrane attachment protein|nr:DnaD domain protein [Streptococcaceae bacterium]
MRPGDTFHTVNSEKTSFDETTFARLYLPVLEPVAASLYQLLRTLKTGRIARLLEHLSIGLPKFESALDKLSALDLIAIYEAPNQLTLDVKSPLTFEAFLADAFYTALLRARLGASEFEQLQREVPQGRRVSKKLSDVFRLSADIKTSEMPVSADRHGFDLSAFKTALTSQKLRFLNEDADILQLYGMADKFQLDWYALFKRATEAANADGTLNLAQLSAQLIRENLSAEAPDLSAVANLSEPQRQLARVAKAHAPLDFLAQLKRQMGGFVSGDEKNRLSALAELKLPDDVQNILIHYIIVQLKRASLVQTLVNRVANDWMRHKVATAEDALARIDAYAAEIEAKKHAKAKPKKTVKPQPAWSNPDFKENTSPEAKAKAEAAAQQMLDALANLGKEKS